MFAVNTVAPHDSRTGRSVEDDYQPIRIHVEYDRSVTLNRDYGSRLQVHTYIHVDTHSYNTYIKKAYIYMCNIYMASFYILLHIHYIHIYIRRTKLFLKQLNSLNKHWQ